jgi:hypothetical protein
MSLNRSTYTEFVTNIQASEPQLEVWSKNRMPLIRPYVSFMRNLTEYSKDFSDARTIPIIEMYDFFANYFCLSKESWSQFDFIIAFISYIESGQMKPVKVVWDSQDIPICVGINHETLNEVFPPKGHPEYERFEWARAAYREMSV